MDVYIDVCHVLLISFRSPFYSYSYFTIVEVSKYMSVHFDSRYMLLSCFHFAQYFKSVMLTS